MEVEEFSIYLGAFYSEWDNKDKVLYNEYEDDTGARIRLKYFF